MDKNLSPGDGSFAQCDTMEVMELGACFGIWDTLIQCDTIEGVIELKEVSGSGF